MNARVFLGDVLVGYLAPAGDVIAFTFDARYLARPDRPVLGQAFEDRVLSGDRPFTGSPSSPLPTFFRNALPEGALRRVVEGRLRRSTWGELDMLVHLGTDLPGALRVIADPLDADVETATRAAAPASSSTAPEDDPIRFSLSGVQLKASVTVDADDEEKITLPLVGQGGRWIAKLPSAAFRDLPENELAMLRWARASGLDVPDHRIVDVASIRNLPAEFPREGRALLVQRFDRSATGARIHQEDFAQVFEIEPEEKDLLFVPPDITVTYASIGAVVASLAGREDFDELVRRVAFMIVCGNADGHAKNWSLVYPDGLHARLSPLYDFVSTVAYRALKRSLPLGLVRSEEPALMRPVLLEAVTCADMRELAEQAGEDADRVEADVRRFVERARDAWPGVRGDAPPFVAEAIDRHLARIALAAD